jgi:hypothetical protein
MMLHPDPRFPNADLSLLPIVIGIGGLISAVAIGLGGSLGWVGGRFVQNRTSSRRVTARDQCRDRAEYQETVQRGDRRHRRGDKPHHEGPLAPVSFVALICV